MIFGRVHQVIFFAIAFRIMYCSDRKQAEDALQQMAATDPQQEAVAKARRRLAAEKRIITAGKIVAELSFGFWTGLTGHAYTQRLWIPHLHRTFSNARLGHMSAWMRSGPSATASPITSRSSIAIWRRASRPIVSGRQLTKWFLVQ